MKPLPIPDYQKSRLRAGLASIREETTAALTDQHGRQGGKRAWIKSRSTGHRVELSRLAVEDQIGRSHGESLASVNLILS